jgi:hypothetical protein
MVLCPSKRINLELRAGRKPAPTGVAHEILRLERKSENTVPDGVLETPIRKRARGVILERETSESLARGSGA